MVAEGLGVAVVADKSGWAGRADDSGWADDSAEMDGMSL